MLLAAAVFRGAGGIAAGSRWCRGRRGGRRAVVGRLQIAKPVEGRLVPRRARIELACFKSLDCLGHFRRVEG